MKIALACQSILLEKTLKIFLSSYLCSYNHCDFVISDRKIEIEKPLFYISSDESDLNLPFSKGALIMALEKFHTSLQSKQENSLHVKKDFGKLEEKIVLLTEEFRENLVQTIKEYYEK
jgi:hypothetical protein